MESRGVKTGLHLPNRALASDERARIAGIGFSSYIALHDQLSDLLSLVRQGARGIVRYFIRDLLALSPVQVCDQLAPLVGAMLAGGVRDLVVGNELNHPIEGRVLPPDQTASRLASLHSALRARFPSIRLHLPAFSPGFPNWLEYLAEARRAGVACDVVDVHAYGSLEGLIGTVQEAHRVWPEKPICITEFNFGAGNRVNLVEYADTVLRFHQWCVQQGYLDGPPHWFIWEWDHPDTALPTSLNLKGSPLEPFYRDVLAKNPAGMVTNPPVQEGKVYQFQFGMKAKAEELGEAVVGRPISPEQYIGDQFSIQFTEKGMMVYSKQANRVHFFPASSPVR